jgi:hypothetical protein
VDQAGSLNCGSAHRLQLAPVVAVLDQFRTQDQAIGADGQLSVVALELAAVGVLHQAAVRVGDVTPGG